MRLSFVVVAAVMLSSCKERKRASDTATTPDPTETAAVAAPTASSAPAPTPVAAAPRKGTVTIGRVTSDVTVPAADLVIGSLVEDYSRCYETTLDRTPTAAGRMDVVLVVEPTGVVVGTPTVEGAARLPPELGTCLAKIIGAARFKGFAGRRATIRVPFTLSLARDAAAPPSK